MRQMLAKLGAGIVLATALAVPVFLIPTSAPAANATVTAANFEFTPKSRSIKPGDTVTWTNPSNQQNPATHSITFTNGPAYREVFSPGETRTRTFSSTGTFDYYCEFHGTPAGNGMAGSITVTTGSTASPTQPTATGTITITTYPTPTPTRKRTSTPKPSSTPTPTPSTPTPTPSPSASPTPTPTPSPTPTESASVIPTFDDDQTGSTSSGNTQALIAIGGVLVLGALGFLVYRRTLSRP